MIDIIKDIAILMKRNNRKWCLECDDWRLTILIYDDQFMDDLSHHEPPERCMKIVYETDMKEAYFDFENIIKGYSKSVNDDFAGFSVDELNVSVDIMTYLRNNAEEINEWIHTYFPVDLEVGE